MGRNVPSFLQQGASGDTAPEHALPACVVENYRSLLLLQLMQTKSDTTAFEKKTDSVLVNFLTIFLRIQFVGLWRLSHGPARAPEGETGDLPRRAGRDVEREETLLCRARARAPVLSRAVQDRPCRSTLHASGPYEDSHDQRLWSVSADLQTCWKPVGGLAANIPPQPSDTDRRCRHVLGPVHCSRRWAGRCRGKVGGFGQSARNIGDGFLMCHRRDNLGQSREYERTEPQCVSRSRMGLGLDGLGLE